MPINKNTSLISQAIYNPQKSEPAKNLQSSTEEWSHLIKTVIIPVLYLVITVIGMLGNGVVVYIINFTLKVNIAIRVKFGFYNVCFIG